MCCFQTLWDDRTKKIPLNKGLIKKRKQHANYVVAEMFCVCVSDSKVKKGHVRLQVKANIYF